MEPVVKRMKITTNIWDYILDFVSEHPEMATGKFSGPNAKQQLQKLWVTLAEKLNSLGYGCKTPAKWQKSFADWKYNVKQKYADIKIQKTKTGGGPLFEKKLTLQEERLMGLIGISCMEGDGVVEEIGLGSQTLTTPHLEAVPSTSKQVSTGPSTSRQVSPEPRLPETFFASQTSPQPIEVVIEQTSDSQSSTGGVLESQPPTPQPSTSSRPPSQQGNRKEQLILERFQSETMSVLRNINNNLNQISTNIERLTNALIDYLNKNN